MRHCCFRAYRILKNVSSVLIDRKSHEHDVTETCSLQGKNAHAGFSVHEFIAGSVTEVCIEQWRKFVSYYCRLAPNEEVLL